MNLETYVLIVNISALSSLIPLSVFAIVVLKKSQPNTVKLLGALVCASALAELLTYIFYEGFGANPNPIVNLYVTIQFILMVLLYRSAYGRASFKSIANMGIVLFPLFAVVDCFIIEGYENLNANSFTVSSIALLLYVMLFFYQLIEELSEPRIERVYMFWVSAGAVMYFGTNLFLFATVDQIIATGQDELFLLSWAMHNGTNILKNLLFSFALYITIPTKGHAKKSQ